jgi:hypothetical protein
MTNIKFRMLIVLVFGLVGLAVALALGFLSTHRLISPSIILALWPTSILGFGSNDRIGTTVFSVILAIIIFGGNAILYALVGLIISVVIRPPS